MSTRESSEVSSCRPPDTCHFISTSHSSSVSARLISYSSSVTSHRLDALLISLIPSLSRPSCSLRRSLRCAGWASAMYVIKLPAAAHTRLVRPDRAHTLNVASQLLAQGLNFAMVISTALMMWKGLSIVTNTESPIVVVLRSARRLGGRRESALISVRLQ